MATGLSLVERYGLALGVTVVALGGRVVLGSWIGVPLGLVLFYPAVLVSAWFGGAGPAVTTTLLCALGVVLSRAPGGPWLAAELLVFLMCGVLIGGLGEARRRTARRADASAVQLAREVESGKAIAALNDELQRHIAEQDELVARERTARAEARLQQRRAELVATLARTVNESLELDKLLRPITVAARQVCGSDAARIALREPQADDMVLRYHVGDREERDEAVRFDPSKGVARSVIATKRLFRTDNAAADASARDEHLWPLSDEGSVAVMVVPIVIGNRVEGLISVSNATLRPFTSPDEALLLRLADHAAIAIKNARLLDHERAARGQAESANRAKDEFLAMLGHELRSPLGAIRNSVPVLNRIGEQFGRVQEIIGRQTYHLVRLLDDLLDVSRLAAGKLTLDRQQVDLKEVAERSLAALEQEGKTLQHGITLTGESVLVEGDATKLEQVVRNLIDNAIKYTPPDGRITITVGRDGPAAVVQVADTGAGISAAALPHIFEPFVQVESSPERSKGGLGLGLSLVKRLVELHGGTVAASSPGPDQGCVFIVRLPLLVASSGNPTVAAVEGPPVSARHILVIEDDPDSRATLRMLLEASGHHVEEAADGASGVQKARLSGLEIALIDVGLPDLDGYAVAKAIRADAAGKSLYLVALTGYSQPEHRRRALEVGFDAHLVKPVDADELAAILAAAFSKFPNSRTQRSPRSAA